MELWLNHIFALTNELVTWILLLQNVTQVLLALHYGRKSKDSLHLSIINHKHYVSVTFKWLVWSDKSIVCELTCPFELLLLFLVKGPIKLVFQKVKCRLKLPFKHKFPSQFIVIRKHCQHSIRRSCIPLEPVQPVHRLYIAWILLVRKLNHIFVGGSVKIVKDILREICMVNCKLRNLLDEVLAHFRCEKFLDFFVETLYLSIVLNPQAQNRESVSDFFGAHKQWTIKSIHFNLFPFLYFTFGLNRVYVGLNNVIESAFSYLFTKSILKHQQNWKMSCKSQLWSANLLSVTLLLYEVNHSVPNIHTWWFWWADR